MSRRTRDFWTGYTIFYLHQLSGFSQEISPVIAYILGLCGLLGAGWLICSGIIDCAQLFVKYGSLTYP